jgi:crotonobetainyl-CoA:carnitine CoA-transferase CaiB-like acyl-CoA transferase
MLALEGIRIMDLSRVGIAAFATMILGDMGAEVIKIDEPRKPGTTIFGSSVSPIGEQARKKAAFRAMNRNKKSVALNLKNPEARQIFYKLVEKTDVILEGFRPGVVKRLGVDYETLKPLNPGLIYCSISGYGQDGPYAQLPGHDANYISIGGALGLIGQAGGPPIIPLNFVADWAGGSLFSTIAILIALIARQKTNKGQYIDISMTDGVVALMTNLASDYFLTGNVPKRGEMMLNGAFPFFSVYQTKDGKYISIACVEGHLWANLCRALGREDFIPYQNDTGQKREEIFAFLRETFRTKTREEWFEELKTQNICVAPVYDLDEVFADPQIRYRNMLLELVDPLVGSVKQVGIPIKLSETPGQVRSLAPVLGQNTEEILSQLGYTEAQMQDLEKAGAIMRS